MKKGWIVVIVVLVLVIVSGYLYLTDDSDFPGCNDSPEERCDRLSGMERDCCLGSLVDGLEKGWEVMRPDCCTYLGRDFCYDQYCEEGYNMVSVKCKGSLTFCAKD